MRIPQDTSAEEPDGGNLHVRIRRGLGLGDRPGLLNMLGELGVQPEEIVREGPYYQNQTTKHAGCQIDWLIQTRYSLYVVEIEFSRSQLTTAIVEEVKQKIHALVTPKNLSVRPVLAPQSSQNSDSHPSSLRQGRRLWWQPRSHNNRHIRGGS